MHQLRHSYHVIIVKFNFVGSTFYNVHMIEECLHCRTLVGPPRSDRAKITVRHFLFLLTSGRYTQSSCRTITVRLFVYFKRCYYDNTLDNTVVILDKTISLVTWRQLAENAILQIPTHSRVT